MLVKPFSASVADAIDYCRNTLKLPHFKGSEATVKYIRTFDHLFDILDSQNAVPKVKAALCKSNKSSWKLFLDEAVANPLGGAM